MGNDEWDGDTGNEMRFDRYCDVRAALMRLLWNTVAERAECTCQANPIETKDGCAECQACEALGFGKYQGPDWLQTKLIEEA